MSSSKKDFTRKSNRDAINAFIFFFFKQQQKENKKPNSSHGTFEAFEKSNTFFF